ncbi:RNA 2',3'-cyclic phosphodiesterase [Paenibacillus ferrarius]|uniref:RNA 2',3'-cyclic phosphodiesterase n=1 Tax=Paenibacillus ferrarius TaxID=1469647 RepID=UPI003D2B7AA3
MNTMTLVRLFVAVPIPPEIKHVVANWIDELKKDLPFRKWVHPNDLHITLQFLGDTPSEDVAPITKALQELSTASSPLSLRIDSLGYFGRSTQPSVLWAGVGGNVKGLQSLHNQVSSILAPLGFKPEERAFHPHLTLARNYTGTTPFDRERLNHFAVPTFIQGDLLTWKTSTITLYRSHLNKQPMYEVMYSPI